MVAAVLDTGAEVITGSTRMKAGTTQKIVMNMLSTMVMVRCGYVYENMMINLKPTNIMIKPTMSGFFSLKLIDFDGSFFANDPPADCEDLQGDPVYLAPEMFLAMSGETMKLSSKVDVFASGLIIHEMLTGELPKFDADYDYAFEAALEGAQIRLASGIPEDFTAMIRDMLNVDPEKRPSFGDLFARITGAAPAAAVPAKAPEAAAPATSEMPKKRRLMRPAGDL